MAGDDGRTNTGRWASTEIALAQLRQEFPHWWGIMHPSPVGLWLAFSGKHITLRAPSAIELRDKLRAATTGDRQPAPGDVAPGGVGEGPPPGHLGRCPLPKEGPSTMGKHEGEPQPIKTPKPEKPDPDTPTKGGGKRGKCPHPTTCPNATRVL
jgi:hypothetical protein